MCSFVDLERLFQSTEHFTFFFNFVSEHFLRFESNTDVANRVNAEIVTKAETATIGELFSYMKQEGAKVQYFILSTIRCASFSYLRSSLM